MKERGLNKKNMIKKKKRGKINWKKNVKMRKKEGKMKNI